MFSFFGKTYLFIFLLFSLVQRVFCAHLDLYNKLPSEIQDNILSHLPFHDLKVVRLINKKSNSQVRKICKKEIEEFRKKVIKYDDNIEIINHQKERLKSFTENFLKLNLSYVIENEGNTIKYFTQNTEKDGMRLLFSPQTIVTFQRLYYYEHGHYYENGCYEAESHLEKILFNVENSNISCHLCDFTYNQSEDLADLIYDYMIEGVGHEEVKIKEYKSKFHRILSVEDPEAKKMVWDILSRKNTGLLK